MFEDLQWIGFCHRRLVQVGFVVYDVAIGWAFLRIIHLFLCQFPSPSASIAFCLPSALYLSTHHRRPLTASAAVTIDILARITRFPLSLSPLGSVVYIVSRLQAGQHGKRSLILRSVQTNRGSHPASCSVLTKGFFPGGKRAEVWSPSLTSTQCRS